MACFAPLRLVLVPMLGLLLLGAGGPKSPTPGQPAPPFTLVTFDKRKVTLAGMKGKVVVINYWATWCGPCKAEMPMMHRYYKANQARGLEMFGVTTENSVPQSQLRKVSDLLSYPLSNRMSAGYGAIDNAVPSTYIIDRKGVVRHTKRGAFTAAEFRAAIDPLLAEVP